jgi:hypothetical protein
MEHEHQERDGFRAFIRIAEDDAVEIGTDLRKADPCLHEPILGALAAHLGFHMEPLTKASSQLDPDPRYPELVKLIEAARKDWGTYGAHLVGRIREMLQAGALLPLADSTEAALHELFADHIVSVQLTFGGHSSDRDRAKTLVKRGLLDPERAHVPIAYRLGRGLEMLAPHRAQEPELAARPLEDIVADALRVKLTPQDEDAMRFAQRRAGLYMRKPADGQMTEAMRVLNDAEAQAVRATVEDAVEERKDYKALARNLADAVQGTRLTNDMDRVARTELAFAHSYGAYVALKEQSIASGDPDPLVYKFVSPFACDDCKRIWGPPADPTTYRLSFIEGREAGGGNFQLPRRQWGPVVGPVHPHCTEGPLQYYAADIVDAINEAADELDAIFGR